MFVWDKDDLNDEQVAAIRERSNVFLEACPGSGKTRTLTYKIALELSNLTDAKKWIISITYTNRAADEIRERIELLGVDTSQLWIGTIHAFCLEWIIKPYGIYHDKLKNGFKIVNSYDSEDLITNICLGLRPQRINYYQCTHYYTPRGIHFMGSGGSLATSVLEAYHQHLDKNHQIDFEQILYFSYELLSNKVAISKILSNLFSYVFIDEYQDTKEIQYSIVASIMKANPSKVKTFIVGDPNQAIYTSLGGYAISHTELESLTEAPFIKMSLDKNYRSSRGIIEYYRNYNVSPSVTSAEGKDKDYQSTITYDQVTHKDDLVEQVSFYIEHNIDTCGIPENNICVIAPWWTHLAALTRNLVLRLPQYSFDGPGLVPFSRDLENFWYKLTRIILTEPSPSMYVKRLRWASEMLYDLEIAMVDIDSFTSKDLLKSINSISIDEEDGIAYLRTFFYELFESLGFDYSLYPMLQEHYESFFSSTEDRIIRLRRDSEDFATDIEAFRRAFKPRSGIKVSTIHGVKGGEYDAVISFGLLEGLVPNFNDSSDESAKKLLYVIGSRARKNLHLLSERGRMTGFSPNQTERTPTEVLRCVQYSYDDLA
ncbi:ATP-dependent helicase [Shewanella eurypsychrophilus]|uniref:DNA 3'-5' helicase n=1 Tax=Shewanella eurypsychrophilus TaxID=2593656 RepID=A0ABX6V7L4_9GAMM|nr:MULTISPECIES: ATP-dependent helicase [Shewanella]QFU23037.1 AAA family ATPase [Shewanella sp. YLB-09]QPG58321.1 ATP-dependent helicase [Shewanella eurypsychrophilus]